MIFEGQMVVDVAFDHSFCTRLGMSRRQHIIL
jgi:hypothetical protein